MKIKDLNKKYKKKIRLDEIVTINCDDGECYLKSSSGVSGIEINFEGQAKITPQLPEGWILQGNNNKLIIFSLQKKTIENQMLFIYEGFMKITSVIACNNKSERYNETFNKSAEDALKTWHIIQEGKYIGIYCPECWEHSKDVADLYIESEGSFIKTKQ